MKPLKILSIIALISAFTACKKETTNAEPEYEEGVTRVIGVKGIDTSSTPFMFAREQTGVLAMDEDPTLRAELIAYYQGIYTIRMTNLTDCQRILRWNYEGLTLDSWDPANDVLAPNAVVTYTLTGDAKPGKILVKAEKSNSTCENSKTLVINITTAILPIKYTSHTTKRVGADMVVNFSTEEPENIDWWYVLWSPDGNKDHEIVKNSFECDKTTKKYTITFAAIPKTK